MGMAVVLKRTLDPLACFGAQLLRSGLAPFLGMLLHRLPEETNLPSIPAAPFAYKQMKPQTESFEEGQRMIERARLQPRGIATRRPKGSESLS
jgi:hypothetical protein